MIGGVLRRVGQSWARLAGGSPLSSPFSSPSPFRTSLGRGTLSSPFGRFPGTGYASLSRLSGMRNPFSSAARGLGTPLSSAYQLQKRGEFREALFGPKDTSGLWDVSFDAAPDGVKRWADLIRTVSADSGVPADVLAAIMEIESGGDPNAVSPKGAVGLMQVMPSYHAHRAQKYGGDLTDPYVNLRVAAEILAENYQKYGDWDKAAAAYFGAIDQYGNITDASDGLTTGSQYVARFRENRKKYAYLPKASTQQAGEKVSAWSIVGGQQYPVTQGYWEYADPSWYPSTGGYHMGIDLAVPSKTPLYAPYTGKVVHAGPMQGYGNAVMIDTGFGYLLLGHLDSVTVRQGQVIGVGDALGLSGNTGFSTGPHLHIEMRDYNGNYIDPNQYLWF